MGLEPYPENIPENLTQRFKNTIVVEGFSLAQQAGNLKTVNCVLLGVLSRWLDVEEKVWVKTLEEYFPPELRESNFRGFQNGRTFAGQ